MAQASQARRSSLLCINQYIILASISISAFAKSALCAMMEAMSACLTGATALAGGKESVATAAIRRRCPDISQDCCTETGAANECFSIGTRCARLASGNQREYVGAARLDISSRATAVSSW